MSWIYHNSHEPFYRNPFGAVACNTEIILRLKVFCKEYVEKAQVHLFNKANEENLEMKLVEEKDGARVYEILINSGDEPGLLWYYFFIIQEGKVFYYGNNRQHLGGNGVVMEQPPPSYQITVFKQEFTVPDWFRKTVMYQIFVDRFFNGSEDGKVLNPKKGGLIHANWDDTPIYVREPDSYAIRRWNYFGGNLAGVIKKLPYLKELGIGVIYFNPVFEASSNHKYDTGNYLKIDPMFGSNDTFRNLCERAKEHNIRVILDGVFSHTGSDSIYFNKEGNYDSLGAYQSKESPYYSWYRFSNYPDSYESWWGIGTLPNVEESDPSYQEFIINAEDSVIRYWMKMGASGWRLDVADELPDPFIKQIRQVMKSVNPESILIGEVWEDASNKISYSEKRTFLMGEELDSVMNYPFRRVFLDFMLGRKDANQLHQFLMSIYENYPREVFFSTMNLVGSHDVARILTLLGDGVSGEHLNESDKEKERLAPKQRKMGIDRLKTLTLVQMTFPGVPCIYYGDEAGMEGYSDPYNRGPYPWGKEDNELQAWYKKIIGLRNKYIALQGGDWLPLFAQGDVYGYMRSKENEWLAVIINRNTKSEVNIDVGLTPGNWQDLLDKNRKYVVDSDKTKIEIPPLGKILLLRSDID